MATTTATLHARVRARSMWRAVIAAPAVVLQALVLIYVGVVGGLLDLFLQLTRVVLPIKRMSTSVERAARAVAPAMLADARDWPILPVLAAITVLVPLSAALQFVRFGIPWPLLIVIHHAVLLGAGGQRFARMFAIKHNEAHRPKGFFRGIGARGLRRYTEEIG